MTTPLGRHWTLGKEGGDYAKNEIIKKIIKYSNKNVYDAEIIYIKVTQLCVFLQSLDFFPVGTTTALLGTTTVMDRFLQWVHYLNVGELR